MIMKRLPGIVTRAAMSILLAGVLYTGWMAVAIPAIKSGFGGLVAKAILWILAPIVTGFDFALGQSQRLWFRFSQLLLPHS